MPGVEECFDKVETVIQEIPEETCNLEPQKVGSLLYLFSHRKETTGLLFGDPSSAEVVCGWSEWSIILKMKEVICWSLLTALS